MPSGALLAQALPRTSTEHDPARPKYRAVGRKLAWPSSPSSPSLVLFLALRKLPAVSHASSAVHS
jgi:hypothetical protein